jgi:nucleotide-binding universal stress UspA family protein
MKILVPIDFSETASCALDFAKAYASKLADSSITLLFVYDSVYDFAANVSEVMEKIEKEASAALNELISENADVQIDYLIEQGGISLTISAMAFQQNFDLIIMGSKGASGTKKLVFGSVAATVVKESKVPVWVIPPNTDFRGIYHISLAVDLHHPVEESIKEAIELTTLLSIPYRVLTVLKEDTYENRLLKQGLEADLKSRYPEITFEFEHLVAEQTSNAFAEYIAQNPHCCLVLLARKKSFFESMFDKSQSVEMAFYGKAPLLVVK